MLTPGLNFIFSHLPAIFLPPLLLIAILNIFDMGHSLPRWILVLASLPLTLVVSLLREWFTTRLTCYRFGAVLPPTVRSYLPGGIDIIARMQKESETEYVSDFAGEFFHRYGNIFRLRISFMNIIHTSEPEHLKAILSTKFESFIKGKSLKVSAWSVLGSGIFNSDGELWKMHRSMARPFFGKTRDDDLELIQRSADKAINVIKERLEQGHAIDFQDAMCRFSMDASSELLFGRCSENLSYDLPYSTNFPIPTGVTLGEDAFTAALTRVLSVIITRVKLGPWWPWPEITGDKTRNDMQLISNVMAPVIRDAIEEKQTLRGIDNGALESGTLLTHLTKYTDDASFLQDELFNVQLAGRDSTAATLTFAVYSLSLQPSILSRLRTEVLSTVGLNRAPTPAELKNMRYLQAVISETLRLFPPIPTITRETEEPTTLANRSRYGGRNSFYIPPGSFILFSTIHLHQRKDLWGPDALQFDPDRFLDERVDKYLTRNPWIYAPFGGGPRMCLGQHFARSSAAFLLVRLLQAFDNIELATESQPHGTLPPASWSKYGSEYGRKNVEKIWPQSNLSLFVKGGLWIRLGNSGED